MASHRKNRRRGRQSAITGFLLVALFAVAALVLLGSQVFVLRNVRVTGNHLIGSNEIIRKADLQLGGSIFSVDREAIARNFEREGAVALEEVRVFLPDTVELAVRERTRRAVVSYLGVALVIDEYGYVMEQLNALPDYGVPVVTGVRASAYQVGGKLQSSEPGQITSVLEVIAALQRQGVVALVSELNAADLDNMYLMARGGMMVRIGDSDNMDEKLTWMSSVLRQLSDEGINTGVLDVSGGKSAVYSAN